MITAAWNRLWEMHGEVKSLVLFNPKDTIKKHLHLKEGMQEKDADLVHEIEDATG